MPAPTARRAWPLWVVAALFAVACTTVATCFHPPRSQSPAKGFEELKEVARRFGEANPELRLVPVSKNGNLNEGFCLSDWPLSRQDISQLICQPSQKHHWQGLVLFRSHKSEPFRSDVAHEIDEWGDGGLLLPGYISLVGDAKLVRHLMSQK
ncbi:MAG TPA: hypothetical protein VH682_15235 [Gemmataceae bacterium]